MNGLFPEIMKSTQNMKVHSITSLSNLILQLETYQECQGITLPDNQQAMHIAKHTVSKKFDFLNYKWSASQNLCNHIFYFWANTCDLLLAQIPEETPVCQS